MDVCADIDAKKQPPIFTADCHTIPLSAMHAISARFRREANEAHGEVASVGLSTPTRSVSEDVGVSE
jgi:hypothetical protein